jgi:adhesin/invasin
VDGKVGTGQAAPSSPLLKVLAPVQVQIGIAPPITPDFAGLTPGFFGLYQVNVVIPANLPANIYPLHVSVKSIASNSQNIQVKALNP